jgi:hypothetical protein
MQILITSFSTKRVCLWRNFMATSPVGAAQAVPEMRLVFLLGLQSLSETLAYLKE